MRLCSSELASTKTVDSRGGLTRDRRGFDDEQGLVEASEGASRACSKEIFIQDYVKSPREVL